MKQRSLFSLSKEHKQTLRERAARNGRTMTAHLELLIEREAKHAEGYAKYLRGESHDPRD